MTTYTSSSMEESWIRKFNPNFVLLVLIIIPSLLVLPMLKIFFDTMDGYIVCLHTNSKISFSTLYLLILSSCILNVCSAFIIKVTPYISVSKYEITAINVLFLFTAYFSFIIQIVVTIPFIFKVFYLLPFLVVEFNIVAVFHILGRCQAEILLNKIKV